MARIGTSDSISSRKASGVSDCGPSQRACSGSEVHFDDHPLGAGDHWAAGRGLRARRHRRCRSHRRLAAAALRGLPAERRPVVLGVARAAETREYALEHGIVDEALGPEAAVGAGWLSAGHGPPAADLVILAAPPAATVDWLRRLGELGYDGVVTDVASTKATIVAAAAEYLHDAVFIGGHPMAGSERSGVTAARPDLFVDAHYVLTPFRTRLRTRIGAARARHVGGRARRGDRPPVHDEAVAVVSHAPHVAAAAITRLAAARAGSEEGIMWLAAGGFKDTRDRRGQPELWTNICLDNASALGDSLDRLARDLRRSPWRWRRVTPRRWTSGSRGPPRSRRSWLAGCPRRRP